MHFPFIYEKITVEGSIARDRKNLGLKTGNKANLSARVSKRRSDLGFLAVNMTLWTQMGENAFCMSYILSL